MADVKFIKYRNTILRSLNKFGVPYKLFGGATVQLIDSDRETEDLDFFIQKDKEVAKRLILALEDCGFNTREELIQQLFGIGNPVETSSLYSTCRLAPNKEAWKDFHLDVAFNLVQWNFENTGFEIVERNGIQISTVSFLTIAQMKAMVYPNPRPKDINDIQFIANYLGLDPATGQPVVEKKGWFRW